MSTLFKDPLGFNIEFISEGTKVSIPFHPENQCHAQCKICISYQNDLYERNFKVSICLLDVYIGRFIRKMFLCHA